MSSFHLGAPNGSYFSISHYISQFLCQKFPFHIGWARFLIIFSRQEKMDLTMALTSLSLPSATNILKKRQLIKQGSKYFDREKVTLHME